MPPLFQYVVAVVIGVAVYLGIFTSVLHHPITIDTLGEYVELKTKIIQSAVGRKIVILSGSNGRFSHSAEEMEKVTGIPSVNLSLNALLSLRYQTRLYLGFMNRGDVLYLPLEYRSRTFNRDDFVGVESKYLVYHQPFEIFKLYSPRGAVHAFLDFDVRYFISSIGEMALKRAGVQRRFNLGTMNSHGDEVGHDAEKARAYHEFLRGKGRGGADPVANCNPDYWVDLAELLDEAKQRGVICVGGLPTTFEGSNISPEVLDFLTAFYRQHGGCMVILPNHSLYPRDHFYDTDYHLQEPYQRAHSRLLAPLLKEILLRGGCGA